MNMFRQLLPVVLLFATTLVLPAQDNHYTTANDSDPEARRLLDAVRAKYDAYRTLTADFRLEIALPGQPAEVQRGSLSRRGDRARFTLGNQEGIINDEAAYIILHSSKEVQINNLPEPGESGGMLTPQSLFDFYESDRYVMAVQRELERDGRKLQVIELKPLDRDESDFTKLRMEVDEAAREIVSLRAFVRDGSNYTFYLDDVRGNVELPDDTFAFDKGAFPGYHVEDLRY